MKLVLQTDNGSLWTYEKVTQINHRTAHSLRIVQSTDSPGYSIVVTGIKRIVSVSLEDQPS